MKGSDLIVDLLKEEGVELVFAISGAGNVHLLESLKNARGIRLVHPHHEQAGVMATLAYNRLRAPGLAVMITTSGGGASNAITGVLDAWADSIPCIVISGQERSSYATSSPALRMWGVQGFDVTKTVHNITKYANMIVDPRDIQRQVKTAFAMARGGRPGPVWLDVPIDIQSANVALDAQVPFTTRDERPKIDGGTVGGVLAALRGSQRPVFLFGNGIRLSGGVEKLREMVEVMPYPFLMAWNGLDMLPTDHPRNYGRAGNYGQRCANFVIQNCDLLLALGTRLAIPQVGYSLSDFARAARKYVVDIDPTELSKFSNDPSFTPIQADAAMFLEQLLQAARGRSFPAPKDWTARCDHWREQYPWYDEKIHGSMPGKINSYWFVKVLSHHLREDEIVVADMGTALTCTHQVIEIVKRQRLITSTGLGEMGFGLPGAIGASLARDRGRVILISGDGSMMMNLQELQTVAHNRLPLKIFVYINDGYLTIRHTQKGLFGESYTGSGEASGVSCPDFHALGKAFGFPVRSLDPGRNLDDQIEEFLSVEGPSICTIPMDPQQLLVPKLSFFVTKDGAMVSPSIEDLSPFLPRGELEREMLIPLDRKSRSVEA